MWLLFDDAREGGAAPRLYADPTEVIVESVYGQLPFHGQPWFRNRYEEVESIYSSRGGEWLRIYRLRTGAALPGRRAAGQRGSMRTPAPRPTPQRSARLAPRSDSSSVPSEPTSTPGSPGGSSS